jgi:hypothetical protein
MGYWLSLACRLNPQELDPAFRSRGRANTNTFSNFPWRRRNETSSTLPVAQPAISRRPHRGLDTTRRTIPFHSARTLCSPC